MTIQKFITLWALIKFFPTTVENQWTLELRVLLETAALYLSAFSSSFRTPRFENTKEKVRDPIVCSCIARFHFFFERKEVIRW